MNPQFEIFLKHYAENANTNYLQKRTTLRLKVLERERQQRALLGGSNSNCNDIRRILKDLIDTFKSSASSTFV